MHAMLGTWFHDISVALPNESLTARGTAIDGLLDGLDRYRTIQLVARAFQQPLSETDDWFRDAFRETDASFLMRGNDRELALLAGACLVELCEKDDELAVLAAVSASLGGLSRWTSLVQDLPEIGEQRLVDIGTSRRQPESRPRIQRRAVDSKALTSAVEKEFETEGVTAAAITRAIQRAASAVSSAIDSVVSDTNQVGAWVDRALALYAEESQLVGWLLSGHSTSLDTPWSSVDAAGAAIVAPRELVSLLFITPPPPHADALVGQLLASTRFVKRGSAIAIPPLEVPPEIDFLVDQHPASNSPVELAQLSLRQAALLEAWKAAE